MQTVTEHCDVFACYSYLQGTLGPSTGFSYQTILLNYANISTALQTKRIDFLYSSGGNIGCAIAEIPGLAVLVRAGLFFPGPLQYWNQYGTILALTSSNITQVCARHLLQRLA